MKIYIFLCSDLLCNNAFAADITTSEPCNDPELRRSDRHLLKALRGTSVNAQLQADQRHISSSGRKRQGRQYELS